MIDIIITKCMVLGNFIHKNLLLTFEDDFRNFILQVITVKYSAKILSIKYLKYFMRAVTLLYDARGIVHLNFIWV